MKVTVKVLNGEETTIEVDETESISTVKNVIAERLKIAPILQRLVYKGKTLADSSSLQSNGITSGEKLYLSVKKGQVDSMRVTKDCHGEIGLWDKMRRLLQSHFTDSDAELVLGKFKEDFGTWLAQLSLDDIERMAKFNMKPDTSTS